jgi:hypothetical protein
MASFVHRLPEPRAFHEPIDLVGDLRDDPARTAGILIVAAGHPGALRGEHSKP